MTKQDLIQDLYLRINELTQLGLLDAAEESCQQVLQLAPQDSFAWYCLSIIARQQGRSSDAILALKNAAPLAADNPSYLRQLGGALHQHGCWRESSQVCRRVLDCDPGDAPTWRTLAIDATMLGRLDEAATAYEHCLALVPMWDDVAEELGNVLCRLGKPNQALSVLQATVARHPVRASAWTAVAACHLLLKDWQATASACERAIQLEPGNRQAHLLSAISLMRQWLLPEAEEVVRHVLQRDPHFADAWVVLGNLLRMQARTSEAISPLLQAIAVSKQSDHHSALLLTWQYLEGQTHESLREAHRHWAKYHAVSTSPNHAARSVDRAGRRPWRLGFVSGDFGVQATSCLALPFFESLDKSRCSIVCYSDRNEEDAITERFQEIADVWHNSVHWPSSSLADQIRVDDIDILIDLMGHTGMRMDLFAGKPAPLQMTWLGYVGTTGLEAIDYLLADRFHVPLGEETSYVENVLRMPNGYVCYCPHGNTPEPSPLPALDSGYVTFGCFNNPAKYSPSMIHAWSEILERFPSAKLLLKFGGLDHSRIQSRIRLQFAQHGVQLDRILFEGWSPAQELFSSYHRVDIGLDTQPYSGGITTCDALWMGVPVITFPGATFAGRHSTSHLNNAGCPQFIASDLKGYVELAVAWASRLDELADVRLRLREQMRRSPLCDAPQFASDFLKVIKQAWQSHRPV
jgi:predicted O-linked N-acetylglucosamine transferase (SPINDLY family)